MMNWIERRLARSRHKKLTPGLIATWILTASLYTLVGYLFSPYAQAEQDHSCQGGRNCNDETPGDLNSDVDIDIVGPVVETIVQGPSIGGTNVETVLSIDTPEERLVKGIVTTTSARAPTAYPTAPCVVGDSKALALWFFSRSKGKGVVDEDCKEREEVRLAPTDAHRIFAWCHMAGVAEKWGTAQECIEYASPAPSHETASEDETVALQARVAAQEVELSEIKSLYSRVERAQQEQAPQQRQATERSRIEFYSRLEEWEPIVLEKKDGS